MNNALLLDTHVWIWYVTGASELKKMTQDLVTEALHHHQAYLAAISLWEICMLDKKQRIILEMPCLAWIKKFMALTPIQILPFTPEIAADSCFLPDEFHDDPADRIITATARIEGLSLVTRDARIIAFGEKKYVSVIKA